MSWVRLGALFMFLGVVLGAFGAHGLRGVLSEQGKQVYHTAVLYHLVHGLGLLAVGLLATLRPQAPWLRPAGLAFVVGIVVFSGSLYLLAVTDIKKLGMITPFGGLAFLAGWLCLAAAAGH